jgi:carbon storage regulator
MLVLSRKPNESIMIRDDIEITVLEIRHGGKVRIGIEAPPHVQVHRKEVWLAIKKAEGNDTIASPEKLPDSPPVQPGAGPGSDGFGGEQ